MPAATMADGSDPRANFTLEQDRETRGVGNICNGEPVRAYSDIEETID